VTRPHRRDKNVRFASVIAGVRLEPDLAQRLCAAAIERAPDERGRGDVAQLARYLVRTGLGIPHSEANIREERAELGNCGVPGLRLEVDVCQQLARTADQLGLNKLATVRHYIRLGLGIRKEVSLQREERFAEIASAKRGLLEG
jgi:hypothetical protein